jgi:hypothetical protein
MRRRCWLVLAVVFVVACDRRDSATSSAHGAPPMVSAPPTPSAAPAFSAAPLAMFDVADASEQDFMLDLITDAGGPRGALAAALGSADAGSLRTAKLKTGEVTVRGDLPVEAVRRVVGRSSGQFRLCYQGGLLRNPALKGGVTVLVVIGPDGAVKSALGVEFDVPDEAVVHCVERAFTGLVFPEPKSGGVVVANVTLAMSPR